MKFLVCLKQVPESTVRLQVAEGATSVVTDGLVWSISTNDEFALELALSCKDLDPTTTVDIVSIGPERSRDALRHAIAMGCDAATFVHVTEPLPAHAVARVLAAVAREAAADIVLCGKQAYDDDQGFIGPATAEVLGWPHLTMLTDLTIDGDRATICKEVDGGHEVWSASLPVVGVVHKAPHEVRYPALPKILAARRAKVDERTPDSFDVDLGGPVAEIVLIEPPPVRPAGRIFRDGDPGEIAAELARLLRDEAKVL